MYQLGICRVGTDLDNYDRIILLHKEKAAEKGSEGYA